MSRENLWPYFSLKIRLLTVRLTLMDNKIKSVELNFCTTAQDIDQMSDKYDK